MVMERFTQKDVYGLWYIPLRTPAGKYITTEMIYDRLAAYEETGLDPEDIVNSVALGQKVYNIETGAAKEFKIMQITNNIETGCRIVAKETESGGYRGFDIRELGTLFFQTREAADRAIEERKKAKT